jgi:glycosyltransferase involved in cell wall biosynthesis
MIFHCSRGLKIIKIISFLLNHKIIIIGVNHGFNLKKFKSADIIFCINKKQILDTKKIVNNPKTLIEYFPNITPITKVKKRTYNLKNKKIIIGTLSRIDFEYKNLDKIVLATKILNKRNINFQIYIGGDFGQIEKLKNLVKENKLENKFVFKGMINDKEKYFREIDIFCMPSKNETFGISYIEAMLNFVPVIATNNDGANDIFTDRENGILIERNNPSKIPQLIADAIEEIINDKNLVEKITKNAYQRVIEEFSFDSAKKRFNEILKKYNLS